MQHTNIQPHAIVLSVARGISQIVISQLRMLIGGCCVYSFCMRWRVGWCKKNIDKLIIKFQGTLSSRMASGNNIKAFNTFVAGDTIMCYRRFEPSIAININVFIQYFRNNNDEIFF